MRVRNPTTLGNADFLSGAVPAHGLIPPPPFLGSSEAFPVHGTWNAYSELGWSRGGPAWDAAGTGCAWDGGPLVRGEEAANHS